jgi:hypothetical protein
MQPGSCRCGEGGGVEGGECNQAAAKKSLCGQKGRPGSSSTSSSHCCLPAVPLPPAPAPRTPASAATPSALAPSHHHSFTLYLPPCRPTPHHLLPCTPTHRIDAATALRAGLVSRVVPQEALMGEALAAAEAIARWAGGEGGGGNGGDTRGWEGGAGSSRGGEGVAGGIEVWEGGMRQQQRRWPNGGPIRREVCRRQGVCWDSSREGGRCQGLVCRKHAMYTCC